MRSAPNRRRGMTLIEVLFAIVILSGVMLALSRFGQGFTRANRNAANLAMASDLATARIEVVRSHGNYRTLVATFNGVSETGAAANPSMENYPGFTRTTQAVRLANDTIDIVTVTVEVTADVLTSPMRKTAVIGAQ
ncbi:MAG: type II secretion system protein [Gemmatimonadaceae bacterium]|nr:type II secretion system protein [Gemmatimonadaceae bacterium]